jgi:hypothetical protein
MNEHDYCREMLKAAEEREQVLRAEVERLREALRLAQWGNAEIDPLTDTVYQLCPECDQSEVRGHSPDCRIGAAMEGRDA